MNEQAAEGGGLIDAQCSRNYIGSLDYPYCVMRFNCFSLLFLRVLLVQARATGRSRRRAELPWSHRPPI
jgi:hypothetical protein